MLAHIRDTHTALGEQGRAFIAEHYSEPEFEQAMPWWECSMNHSLAIGQMPRKSR